MPNIVVGNNGDGIGLVAIWDSNQPLSNQVASDANQVWFDLNHPNTVDPLLINIADPNFTSQEIQDFLNQAKVTDIPTILFFERKNGQNIIRARVTGNASYVTIKNTYLAILESQDLPLANEFGVVVQSDFGLFPNSVGFNLPAWLWLILAAAGGYKATTSKGNTKKLIWGSIAAISVLNYSWKQSSIGKLTDSRPIRRGSRVDEYWTFNSTVDIRKYLGRSETKNQDYYFIPEVARKHFKLHSIEFGNWMNQDDRFAFLYSTLISLADMAKVMGVGHSKMGFGKKLALAFGARGKGGNAAAFYIRQPYYLINLTKPHGRYTLTHEYGHAMDNILGLRMKMNFASGGRSSRKKVDYSGLKKGSVKWLFERLFEILFYTENGEKTAYHKDLLNLSEYYNRRNEIFARAFEIYIMIKFERAGITNTWTVKKGRTRAMPHFHLIEKAMPIMNKIVSAVYRKAKVSGTYDPLTFYPA